MTAALGVILRGTYDANALRFFAAAGITNGVEKNAVNTMVRALKSAGLWSLFYALYPIVGGNATAHAQNLISASFPITWVNGPTQDANGVTFNGTTQYGNCVGLTGNTIWPHLCGIGAYVRTNAGGAGNHRTMGVSNAGSTILYLLDRSVNTNNRAIMGAVAGLMSQTAAVALGHVCAQRTSTTDAKMYDDGVQTGTYVTLDASTPPALDMYLGVLNLNGAPLAGTYSATNLAMAYVSQGLTAAQVATLTTIIEAYQDALGRGVV